MPCINNHQCAAFQDSSAPQKVLVTAVALSLGVDRFAHERTNSSLSHGVNKYIIYIYHTVQIFTPTSARTELPDNFLWRGSCSKPTDALLIQNLSICDNHCVKAMEYLQAMVYYCNMS